MKDNFTLLGFWYLPDNPSFKIPGNLIHEQGSRIQLELFGTFTQYHGLGGMLKPTIILGDSTDGQKITLKDCYISNQVNNIPGIETTTFNAHEMFIGSHFQSVSEMVFNQVTISFSNLDEWLNMSGFVIDFDDDQTTKIFHNIPPPIFFDIDKDFSASFSFGLSGNNMGGIFKNISVTQHTVLSFQTKGVNFPIFDFLNRISIFQTFLTFATYQNSFPTSIYFISDRKSGLRNTKVSYFYIHSNKVQKNNSHPNEMLFNYNDIKSEFNSAICKWFEKWDKFKPILGLLFNNIRDKSVFNENKFINIVRAVETFHRRFKNNEVLDPIEYKNMVNSILSSTDSKYKDWLKNKLAFGNEPTLHSRLHDLLSEFDNSVLASIIADKNIFVKNIKNSRNYYTHYDKKLENKHVIEDKLFFLTEKLTVLLIFCILSELEFKNNYIHELILKNQNRLFNYLSNFPI